MIERLPELIAAMREDDLLMITADHGNDPTYAGTDHTREYIPLLVYSPSLKRNDTYQSVILLIFRQQSLITLA